MLDFKFIHVDIYSSCDIYLMDIYSVSVEKLYY